MCSAGMYGWTALLVASQGDHLETVLILLKNKPNLNLVGQNKYSALHFAIKNGSADIAVFLIEAGANLSLQVFLTRA